MRSILFALALASFSPAAAAAPAPSPAASQRHERLSPFEAVRWGDGSPEVLVRGTWYRLDAVAGQGTPAVLAHCQRQYGDKWRKRFEEDLVQVLTEMDEAPPRRVELVLADLKTGRKVVLPDVEMTEANRRRIWEAARLRARGEPAVDPANVMRVVREHASEIPPELADLARPNGGRESPSIGLFEMGQDLDQLEWAIEHHYSYRDLRGFDYRAGLDAIRASFRDEGRAPVAELAARVARLLARFGDGHTRISGLAGFLRPGYAPFLVEETGGRLVAFLPDRSGLVDEEHPFLVAIDGLDVERWIAAGAGLGCHGSPHFERRQAIRNLRQISALRAFLDRPGGSALAVTLASAGGDTREVELRVSGRRPTYGQRLAPDSRRIGDVGYLRIPEMSSGDDVLPSIDSIMAAFEDTDGLVIDVRENGGGSRSILRHLAPYFLGARERAWVANVAAYRLHEGDDPARPAGYLDNRWLFPAAFDGWSADARKAISKAKRSFEPAWEPTEGDFSDWHYFVLEEGANPDAYRYDEPVVILMDGGCYSATDVFLGAFAGRKGITLMGTPSGGGSGRSRGLTLAHSRLDLRLSSMASFRPDGRLYDGVGIEPDVVVEPGPGDFVGRGDAVLDAALARLGAR